MLERETKHKPQAPVAPTPQFDEKALTEGAAPTSRELLDAFDEFLGAFEAFKSANDERLAQIEGRLSADVVTTEKMERINRALDSQKRLVDELSLRERRPQLSRASQGELSTRAREHKAAWDRYVRVGDAALLLSFERKSLSAGSDPDGGYIVPHETEAMIDRVLTKISPIREIATVRQIGAASFRKPMNIGGTESGWVGETAARPETDTPTLTLVEFPAMELYAQPAATQTLLDDANVNIEEWLAGEVQTVFAEQEGDAFVNGDGTAKPKGFLAYTKVADASWAWDKIGYLPSGADGAFAASNPADKLIDLVYAPKQAYRANGRWVMNRKTESGDPQIQGRRGQLYLAAGCGRRRAADLARLSGDRGRAHAGHRVQRLRHRLRRFRARLSRGGPRRHPRAARSLQRQALRALLHHQARGRRRAEFRSHQAAEVRRVVNTVIVQASPLPLGEGGAPFDNRPHPEGPRKRPSRRMRAIAQGKARRVRGAPSRRTATSPPHPEPLPEGEGAHASPLEVQPMTFGLTQLVPPAAEPVTRDEAKAHLRVTDTAEDALIDRLIAVARQAAEAHTQRAFLAQTFRLARDAWPDVLCLSLPRPPLVAVDAVRLYDADGNATVWSASSYSVDIRWTPGRLCLKSGWTWPAPGRRQGGIEIDFQAGYGANAADVPAALRQAVLMLVGHLYENREAIAGETAIEVPAGAAALLAPYRVLSL